MSKIRSFANNKIKRHNSSSTKTYVITLYIHFSHRDKNSVMAPKNLNTLMFTNLISINRTVLHPEWHQENIGENQI